MAVGLAMLAFVACGSASTRVPLERAVGTLPTTTTAAPTTTAPPPTPTAPPPAAATVPPAVAVLSPHGFPLPVNARGPAGWVVQTPCGNAATLAAGTPLATPTAILDPGHV